MKQKSYKNRYGDIFTFTKTENGDILWEGNFKWCRFGMPNDYTKAYKQWCNDFPETEMLSLEDFKNIVHKYDEVNNCYTYDKYVRLVESKKDEIGMVDPSGGCYLSVGMSLDFLGFKNCIIEKFEPIPTGYKIIIKK